MPCMNCNGNNLVTGTMEGIVISPISELTKSSARGVYGLTVQACQDCGTLIELRLTVEALELLDKLCRENGQINIQGKKGLPMQCDDCGSTEFIEGTLEGAYFKPSKRFKRGMFAKPVHHPRALVCLKCGLLSKIKLNVEELAKVTRVEPQNN